MEIWDKIKYKNPFIKIQRLRKHLSFKRLQKIKPAKPVSPNIIVIDRLTRFLTIYPSIACSINEQVRSEINCATTGSKACLAIENMIKGSYLLKYGKEAVCTTIMDITGA